MHAHKIAVGLMMVFSHFVILVMILAFWIAKGFLFDEMITALGLVGPLFAGYTTVILTYIIQEPEAARQQNGTPVSWPYRIVSLAIPFLFSGVVAASVVLWAYRIGFTDFEQFKILVGLLEGAFGVYAGQVIYGMFKEKRGASEGAT